MGNKVIEGNLNVLGTIQQNGAPVAGCEIITLPSGDEGTLQSEVLAKLVANPFGFILHQPSRDAVYFEYIGTVNEHTLIYRAPIKALTTGVYEYEFRVNDTTGDWTYREGSYSVDVPEGTTIINLPNNTGILTDEQVELLKGNNCIIKRGVYLYYKYEEQLPSMVRYYKKSLYTSKWNGLSSELHFEQCYIDVKNKSYTFYSNSVYINKVLANQPLEGTEATLNALQIANTNYKIAPAVNPTSIADAYDNTKTYVVGDYVFYNNTLYICSTAIETAEDFDSSKWTEIKLTNILPDQKLEIIIFNSHTTSSGVLTDDQAKKIKENPNSIAFWDSNSYWLLNNADVSYINNNEINSVSYTKNSVVDASSDYDIGPRICALSKQIYCNVNDKTWSYSSWSYTLPRGEAIIDNYRPTATYSVGDYCLCGGRLYICTTAITNPHHWNSSEWTQTSLIEIINNLPSIPAGLTGNEIEVVPYQTTTALTDEQLTKALNGKLAVLLTNNNARIVATVSSINDSYVTFTGVYNAETAYAYDQTRVPRQAVTHYSYCYLWRNTKKLSNWYNGNTCAISTNSDNFIADYTTPAADGKQVMRALNLRRTQDMICQDYYSPSSTYSVGDVVIYENKLYECSTDISVAEAWDSTHWTQINLVDYAKKQGMQILELSSATGTLSDSDYEKVISDNCLIRRNHGTYYTYYHLYERDSDRIFYIRLDDHYYDTSTSGRTLYLEHAGFYCVYGTKAYTFNYNHTTTIVTIDPNNNNGNTIYGLQFGNTKYKLPVEADAQVLFYSDYTTDNSLSDELITKAKAGKIMVYYYESTGSTDVYLRPKQFTSNTIKFEGQCFIRGYSNDRVPYVRCLRTYKAELSITDKKLCNCTYSSTEAIADDSGNFLTSPDIPTSTDKKLVRGLNLRRTQDMINEDVYDNTATYAVDDIVIYQNNLYICKTAVDTPEAFDSTKWEKTSIIKLIKDIKSQL